MLNTFTFGGFKIADEYFMSEDCYIVITDSKKDEDGDEYNVNVEYDLQNGQFSFSKCYDYQVFCFIPCDDMPTKEKIKVQRYILEKVSKALEEEKGKEPNGELHGMEKVMESAFYHYILMMNEERGDMFIAMRGGTEVVDLVKEAEKWKETNVNNINPFKP